MIASPFKHLHDQRHSSVASIRYWMPPVTNSRSPPRSDVETAYSIAGMQFISRKQQAKKYYSGGTND